MIRAALVAVVAACRPAPVVAPTVDATAGVTLSLYAHAGEAYGLVDDRRAIELAGSALVLHDIDPAAPLSSLVIEPLGDSDLRVGACTRDLELRCEATGRRGRHLVRVLYVSPQLRYATRHAVEMTASDRATITTRYAVVTPRRRTTARVTLFRGMPGRERTPIALAEDTVVLDGSTAIFAPPPTAAAARVRFVYRPGSTAQGWAPPGPATEREGSGSVWSVLELDGARLVPAPVHARIAIPGEPERDLDVPHDARRKTGDTLRLPLWIDPTLRASHTRVVTGSDDASLAERFTLSIANTGEVAREVIVEEPLRKASRRRVKQGWPSTPELAGDVARLRLVIPPGAITRASFVIDYDL